MGRREELADAGVRLVARSGIRALTHRAVDVEAGVPAGSTSYYARSRRELTGLVVARITEQLEEDLRGLDVPPVLDDAAAVSVARAMLDRLAARADAQAVRLALLSELRDEPDLRAPLTSAAPVRAALVDTATGILRAIGVRDPATHSVDLVGLVDALLLYDVADAAPLDATRVLTAYLAGLPRR
ncbi:TetR/AcrR family transcriptional regulator [Clavibacter capsici]|uniref:TetR/AcrR family transcriptional regulator n=1 Tax=Clavibacter capsici TaxID=1874630 RepID=UPI00293E31CD|nr:hypothetical protein [Clavibacter capsici]